MTPDQLASYLKTISGALRIAAAGLGQPLLITAADAIDSLANNATELLTVFHGVTTLVQFFQSLIGWLSQNNHNVAATYLNTLRPYA